MTGRIIVQGDVHGCVAEAQRALEKARFDPSADELWSIGDLIDRGPDSVGVVELYRALGGKFVLGNHEDKLLRWHDWQLRSAATGEAITMPADPETVRTYEQLKDRPELLDWLAHAPLAKMFEDEYVCLIHAGIRPGHPTQRFTADYTPPYGKRAPNGSADKKEIERNRDLIGEATTLRFVRRDGQKWKQIAWREKRDSDEFWADHHNPRAPHVIYGHQPWRSTRAHVNATGIDLGCVHGGALLTLVIPRGERDPAEWRYQVTKADRVYWSAPDGSSAFLLD